MASVEIEIAEYVPKSELCIEENPIEEIFKENPASITENDKVEDVPQSVLSVKDQTIEDILKQKAASLLGRKQRRAKNKKSSKVKIRKRTMKIIRSITQIQFQINNKTNIKFSFKLL